MDRQQTQRMCLRNCGNQATQLCTVGAWLCSLAGPLYRITSSYKETFYLRILHTVPAR
jgi:hypothetical protein